MEYIAVLITVHNRKEKTINCLKHLFAQQDINGYQIEVYLTDDGCTDGTREAIVELYPQVNIVDGDGNLYWNRGMYRAWEEAVKVKDYDFYLWLNDDTFLMNFSIATLLSTIKSFDNNSIVVGTTSSFLSEEYPTYGGRKKNGALIVPGGHPQICHHFNGNIVLIPRKVFKLVGFNDPLFHHTLGDFDYGLRSQKFGIQSFVSPNILGYCEVHSQLPKWCNPAFPLNHRWRAFRTPLGHNPEEYFIFELRHKKLARAIFHYLTNHVRVIFPTIWI